MITGPGAIHIVSAFFAIGVVIWVRFLLTSPRSEIKGLPTDSLRFVWYVSVIVLTSTALTLLLGVQNIFLAIFLSIGLVISFLDPLVAVSFMTANLLMRPWELLPEGGAFSTIWPKSVALVALLSWVFQSIRRASFKFTWKKEMSCFLIFIGWLFLSAVIQGQISEKFGEIFSAFFPIVVIALLLINSFSAHEDLKVFQWTLITAVCGVLVLAVYDTYIYENPILLHEPGYVAGRLSGVGQMGNSNDLASLVLMILPLFFHSMKSSFSNAKRKQMGYPLLIFFLLGIFLTQSRSAVMAVVIVLLVSLSRRVSFKKLLLIGASVAVILTLGLGVILKRGEADLEGSTTSRLNYHTVGYKMLKSSPIFGVGYGNYPVLYESFSEVFDEWGQRTAHSCWVLVASEAGLIGLLMFLILNVFVFKRAFKMREQHPEYFHALLTYGFMMFFLSHTYLMFPYILFFLITAAADVDEKKTVKEKISSKLTSFKPILVILISFLFVSPVAFASVSGLSGSEKVTSLDQTNFNQVVTLNASRGETVNFQMKVKSSKCEKLQVTIFKNKSGVPLKLNVRMFKAEKIAVKHPSYKAAKVGKYYDPLIALNKREICPVSGKDASLIWGELEIPKKSTPGNYSAQIQIPDAKPLTIKLNVWKMTIPEKHALPAYSELTSWFVLKGHHGKWQSGEEKLNSLYAEEMLSHRIIPYKSSVARPAFLDKDSKTVLNISDSPTKSASFKSVVLDILPEWAYFDFLPVDPSKRNDPDTEKYLKSIQNTLESLKNRKSFYYLWDEPPLNMLDDVANYADKAKKAAPDLKILVTTTPTPKLLKSVDIFVPVINFFEKFGKPTPSDYKKYQSQGKEVWWYVSCMSHGCGNSVGEEYSSADGSAVDTGFPDFVVERDPSYIRSISWLSRKYSIDAFLYYSVVDAYRNFPEVDPWKSIWHFTGNGDGTLFYPGRAGERGFEEHQPVPSIRLKVWREASFDAEYIKWMQDLKEKPEWFEKDFNSLVTSTKKWSKNYSEYEKLKIRIGNYLNSL